MTISTFLRPSTKCIFKSFFFFSRKNKIKALYGYWTHCFYSCDLKIYEDYLKAHKEIPTINIDACFRPKLQTAFSSTKPFVSPSTTPLKQNHSDSELHNNNNNNNNNIGEEEAAFEHNTPTSIPGSCELWRANPMPEYSSQYYNFNYFTMCLNELKSEYLGVIAPTDSRFRNDVRCLENCDLDGASREKQRLEEKQRESKRNRKDEWTPRWFQLGKSPVNSNDELWLFTNKYWSRDYASCPILY